MATDTLTTPAAKAKAAAAQNRSLRAGVARFSLGQADIRKRAPFLLNRNNVI